MGRYYGLVLYDWETLEVIRQQCYDKDGDVKRAIRNFKARVFRRYGKLSGKYEINVEYEYGEE